MPYPTRLCANQALTGQGTSSSNPRLVGTVAARLGIPETTVLDVFESPETWITAAFTEGLRRLSEAAREADRPEAPWLERIQAGLVALLRFLDDEPEWARFLVLDRPLEGPALLECRRRVRGALSEVLNEARGEVIVGAELWPSAALLAELVVTAVFSVIRARMLERTAKPLGDLAPSLMSFIVAPYLGRGAAKADALGNRAAAIEPSLRAEVVPIRPHPRVMSALRVIASTPRLSNGEIASAVGITPKDGGHTSKLLKTLEQRGLIENASPGDAVCEPNAWLLTTYGRRVLELITDSLAAAHVLEEVEASHEQASGQSGRRPGSRGRIAGRRAT
ncbi:MAG TPA: hypothetical protein VKG38_04325 [Solirubrobacteraceae bacterium]|nr:hypothetical protein [Solirubrobacteraceae bacterium]